MRMPVTRDGRSASSALMYVLCDVVALQVSFVLMKVYGVMEDGQVRIDVMMVGSPGDRMRRGASIVKKEERTISTAKPFPALCS